MLRKGRDSYKEVCDSSTFNMGLKRGGGELLFSHRQTSDGEGRSMRLGSYFNRSIRFYKAASVKDMAAVHRGVSSSPVALLTFSCYGLYAVTCAHCSGVNYT